MIRILKIGAGSDFPASNENNVFSLAGCQAVGKGGGAVMGALSPLCRYLFDDVASNNPKPTNKDPLVLLTILILPGFEIHPLA